ncbi:hypothetical protein ACF8EA_18495 [Pseudomonas sp. YQ_5]|uniref:hypothetical protein n=1 Tax=Pseudomonas sp. YQ_5 TaxID=3367229 RepID=UPI00370AFB3B
MEFDEIEFTEWQIEKIRVALNNYRIASARNGRLPSWTQVRNDIACSDINIDKYSEDDAELAFKPEALRRFAARITVLGLDRLKDLTRFLLHSKLIDIQHLDEDKSGLREMLAVHQYIATKDICAKEYIIYHAGVYEACFNPRPERQELFELKITLDKSKEFLRITETHKLVVGNPSEEDFHQRPEFYTRVKTIRNGYGVLATDEMRLHAFLSDEACHTICVSYIQTGVVIAEGSSSMHVCLLRNGPSHNPYELRTRLQPDGSTYIPNALNFLRLPKNRIEGSTSGN